MIKTLLNIILIFGFINLTSGQKEIDENTFFVINVLGANLYEQPSLSSSVIKKIKPGVKIIAEEIIKTEQTIKIGNNFYFDGNFISIKNKSFSGFIFSSDLTKLIPILKKEYDGILIPNIQGGEKSKRTKKRIEKYGNEEYVIEDEITEFENIVYTYYAFDGCFNHSYLTKNMSLNEAYHQLTALNFIVNETKEGNFIQVPKFIEKIGNEYFFDGEGATEDLKITENKDGTFTISSYDCT